MLKSKFVPRISRAACNLSRVSYWCLGTAVCGISLMIATATIDPSMATQLTKEDGFVENLTMLFFASAGALCTLFAFHSRGSLRYYLGLWALLSFLFCGEEISWGQRWFNYETPEFLSDNYQGEANIHNLSRLTPRVVDHPTDLVTSQGAFYVGFFTYFLLFPAGMWLSSPCRRFGKWLGFPPISAALLAAIWLPVATSFVLAKLMAFGASREALTEMRELYFALSILLYALLLAWYSTDGFSLLRAKSNRAAVLPTDDQSAQNAQLVPDAGSDVRSKTIELKQDP